MVLKKLRSLTDLPLKGWVALSVSLTTLSTFAGTQNTDDQALKQAIQQIGKDISQGSLEGIKSGKDIVAFVMFILFFLFVIGGGIGAWFWYTKTRGNPQQPADTRIAAMMAVIGVIGGIIVWTALYYLIKSKLGVDVVQIIKGAS